MKADGIEVKEPVPYTATGALPVKKVADPTWKNGWLHMGIAYGDVMEGKKRVGSISVDPGCSIHLSYIDKNGESHTYAIKGPDLWEFVRNPVLKKD